MRIMDIEEQRIIKEKYHSPAARALTRTFKVEFRVMCAKVISDAQEEERQEQG